MTRDDFKSIWTAIDGLKTGQGWRVGFWTMVVISTICLPFIGTSMVQNDRLRSSEDIRIETSLRKEFFASQREIAATLTQLQGDVREIKTSLKYLGVKS